jgi:hypothetical protein
LLGSELEYSSFLVLAKCVHFFCNKFPLSNDCARSRKDFDVVEGSYRRAAKPPILRSTGDARMKNNQKVLSSDQQKKLIGMLKARFEKHLSRHQGVDWASVQAKLESNPEKLWSVNEMERTGGEPDVVGYDRKTGEFIFYDCSAESPAGRRSLCYDREALESRKADKPKDSAREMASAMGIELLTEEQYRGLQSSESFDTKTSSWVKTPPAIRKLGGALFCDRRYDAVFVYHNGAESYYAARGFRGWLRV